MEHDWLLMLMLVLVRMDAAIVHAHTHAHATHASYTQAIIIRATTEKLSTSSSGANDT